MNRNSTVSDLNLLDWSCNNLLAVCLGGSVYLWNAASGEIDQLLQMESSDQYVGAVAWIKEGNYLALGTSNGEVQVGATFNGKSAKFFWLKNLKMQAFRNYLLRPYLSLSELLNDRRKTRKVLYKLLYKKFCCFTLRVIFSILSLFEQCSLSIKPVSYYFYLDLSYVFLLFVKLVFQCLNLGWWTAVLFGVNCFKYLRWL